MLHIYYYFFKFCQAWNITYAIECLFFFFFFFIKRKRKLSFIGRFSSTIFKILSTMKFTILLLHLFFVPEIIFLCSFFFSFFFFQFLSINLGMNLCIHKFSNGFQISKNWFFKRNFEGKEKYIEIYIFKTNFDNFHKLLLLWIKIISFLRF